MAFNGSVVIIVPSQGHSTHAFEEVAKELKSKMFPKSRIVKTTVSGTDGNSTVQFNELGGDSFIWQESLRLSRAIFISHAGFDGPNLSYGSTGIQPWSFVLDEGKTAREFWTSVGKAMVPEGKIYLFGCHMGESAYAELVSNASGREVFGSTDFFAAGKRETVMRYARSLEEGTVPKPLKAFH